ncbi:MAG: hypothetical protein H6661_09010 [Ardenticatenaceae bacterium]|nr:hypothetical protein [Ardenticatenaceae bacterium]
MPFQVAINRKYQDKVKPGDGRFWDFNMSFQNETLSLPDFLAAIVKGHAWTAPHRHQRHHQPRRDNPDYHTSFRVKANVIGSQLLALDSDTEDERSSFAALLADTFIGHYAAVIHASASSTWSRPRSRVIFLLDEALNPEEYELALQALLFRYPFCDQSVKHAAAVFYGAQDCAYCLLRHVLPVAILRDQILRPYQNHLQQEAQKREAARARRLAAVRTVDTPPADQVLAYVQHTWEAVLDELATTSPGLGLRHSLLFEGALQLASLHAAPWLTDEARRRLSSFEDDLYAAALQNSYVADYGEEDAWRTIENGADIGQGRPYDEPTWLAPADYFRRGEQVEAVFDGEVVARGRIRRLRERGHWEFELDSHPFTWFARSLLRHAPEED